MSNNWKSSRAKEKKEQLGLESKSTVSEKSIGSNNNQDIETRSVNSDISSNTSRSNGGGRGSGGRGSGGRYEGGRGRDGGGRGRDGGGRGRDSGGRGRDGGGRGRDGGGRGRDGGGRGRDGGGRYGGGRGRDGGGRGRGDNRWSGGRSNYNTKKYLVKMSGVPSDVDVEELEEQIKDWGAIESISSKNYTQRCEKSGEQVIDNTAVYINFYNRDAADYFAKAHNGSTLGHHIIEVVVKDDFEKKYDYRKK